MSTYTAVYKHTKKWYLGWIEEVPGVNSQGKTLKEVRENLREALQLVVETNRLLTRVEAGSNGIVREKVKISFNEA
ncbi:MAG: type II toxin-antitoxin system HicB family antitoxin [Patescibacteria group bacterium]